LINIKNGAGVGDGRWFDANVGREVGDGTQLYFGGILGLMVSF